MHSIEQLVQCEQITEWVSLNDPRLVIATGEPAPNRGTSLRENWGSHLPQDQLVTEVARLLVPSNVRLSQPRAVSFGSDVWKNAPRNSVLVRFASTADWLRCFPLGEASRLPTSDEDWGAWAGVALCGSIGALAVFAQEKFDTTTNALSRNGVEARIQPVPTALFERIVNT